MAEHREEAGGAEQRPASSRRLPMVVVPDGVIGAQREVGRVTVSTAALRAYAQRSGDENPVGDTAPPAYSLTFLALRRRGAADVRVVEDAFSVHGGHDIEQREAIRADCDYPIHSAVDDVFEKSGRSGPLTVIARVSKISGDGDRLVAVVRERQIVRWRPRGDEVGQPRRRHRSELSEVRASAAQRLEVGDVIAREIRRGPPPQGIANWAAHLGEREVLFSDRSAALDLGYEDLVVPGPMLSAFAGQMLRRALPAWSVRTLSMTFRQSLLADEPIALTALLTEVDTAARLSCDLVIESGTGEICATGLASLVQDATI